MPQKCCVPGCNGNYKNGPKVHVFGFPKDVNLRQKWLKAIPRDNFEPTNNTKVCEAHFPEGSIIKSTTVQDSNTGKIFTIELLKPRLREDSIPSIFLNCPSYLSKNVKIRPSKDEKLKNIDELNLSRALEISKIEFEEHEKNSHFDNFEEFIVKFSKFKLPKDWFSAQSLCEEGERLTIFKIEYSPGPCINWAIVINYNLNIETFLYSELVCISTSKFKTPFISHSLDDIHSIFEAIDVTVITLPLEENITDNDNPDCGFNSESTTMPDSVKPSNDINKIKRVLNFVSNILESFQNLDDNKIVHALNFICEQLTLLTTAKERYRYSSSTIILCSILYTISPHAYKYLRDYGSLILPHPQTIMGICNKHMTDPHIDEKNMFLTYARNVFGLLKGHERFVTLLFDEIHIEPFMDYKGGNIAGTAVNNNNSLASSAFTFMITSVCSSFKEVVHIAPVSKINSELLYNFIKTIIENLEEIGYVVFCTISDNNAINGKAMGHFSTTDQLSIVYPHPVDNERPLFYLFDTVHLIKCIFNNWLNSKPDQMFDFPDFDTSEKKYASFSAIKKLHELEYDKLLKFGYSLNLKALFPSSLERQNVKLSLKIFNSFVVEALRHFGSRIPHSRDTADFVNIITIWWKIVNVKTPFKGKHKRDIYQEPIIKKQLTDIELDPKIEFLEKMLSWLDTWEPSSFSKTLTRQTRTALSHTLHGLLEITKYCFNELGMNYVLLGKFQTDPLEDRFGKYRQMAGGHYHISLRQLYETEKRLRIQSILTLQSRSFGPINVNKFYELPDYDPDENCSQKDFSQIKSLLSEILINDGHFQDIKDVLPLITYLGGYCSYITLKNLKCEICKQKLVYDEQFIVEDNFDLINKLNRGGLLYPQEHVVNVVSVTYIIFNMLINEFEDIFLETYNKRSLMLHLMLEYCIEQKYVSHFDGCANHNGKDILKIILKSISNTLLKNYCAKNNNHLKKRSNKRKLDTLTK